MVSFTTITLSLLSIPLALGRVTKVTAPTTAHPGENITATLDVQSYIQNWNDFGVIWGLKSINLTCAECLGTQISYNNLYNETGVTQLGNQTVVVPIPDNLETGEYTLVAAIPYLVGASGETGIRTFNQSITLD